MVEPIRESQCSETVIFVHVPKAAGSTLHQIIERQYDPETMFTLRVPDNEVDDELKRLPAAQRMSLKMLKGHMRFGLHEYLSQPAIYITVLRDPVDRLVSYYHYVLRSPENEHHRDVVSQQMSLCDYIRSGLLKDNGQTRRLAGVSPAGRCPYEVLEIAKKNLRERFAVVGISERFDETVILMKRFLGWKMPFYVKANVTRKRPVVESIPEETLALLRAHTALDRELYDYSRQLFEELIGRQGASFRIEVAVLRVLNRFYQSARFMGRPVKRVIGRRWRNTDEGT